MSTIMVTCTIVIINRENYADKIICKFKTIFSVNTQYTGNA